MLWAALSVLGLLLPPTHHPVRYVGRTLGVAIVAEVLRHDPGGAALVARLELRGALLGGGGHISGFARVDAEGRVTPAPHLRRQFAARRVEVLSVGDADPPVAPAGAGPRVPEAVVVRVKIPIFSSLSVRLTREGTREDWTSHGEL